MTIESLNNIIGGEIVQKGTSEEVFRATVYPGSVEEGDLCFVQSPEEAEKAIAKGVGVLVAEEDLLLPENFSITLIRVHDLKKAAFILAGYVVGVEDASFELLSEKQMSFLKMILMQKNNIAILPEDWKKAFELILDSSKRLFVGTDESMLGALRAAKKPFAQKASGHIVSADSLFRTTFKIDKYIYQYMQMTPFHIDHLRSAVALCEAYELPYKIDKVTYTKHFRPVFLEGEPSIQEVMKNDKVVILSDNLDDIIKAREYASDVGNWMAKTIVMVPPKTKVEGVKYPTYYRSNDEIFQLIGTLHYNYLFIYTEEGSLFQKIQNIFTV